LENRSQTTRCRTSQPSGNQLWPLLPGTQNIRCWESVTLRHEAPLQVIQEVSFHLLSERYCFCHPVLSLWWEPWCAAQLKAIAAISRWKDLVKPLAENHKVQGKPTPGGVQKTCRYGTTALQDMV